MNKLTTEAKVEIVVAALKKGDKLVKSHLAKEKGIDPKTLNRYMKQYHSEAKKRLEVKPASMPTKRGGKPRNGRVSLILDSISKFGVDGKTAEIYKDALQKAEEQNMREISKYSWYSMIAQIRNNLK
jgi:hypothetical protein